jgi:hypothetical protein
MQPFIAFCNDSPSFTANRILDPKWAANFPGALSMACLAGLAGENDRKVVTGDVALSHVESGRWNARDIAVVQDMDAESGLELVRRGSRAAVLIALESPIFAWRFYDRLAEIAPMFEHRILFKGAFEAFWAERGEDHAARFPAFSRGFETDSPAWRERDCMVMVAANKFYTERSRFPLTLSFRRYRRFFGKHLEMRSSGTLRYSIENELQSKRLSAIEYFGGLGKLALFGRYWDKPGRMPKRWRKRLAAVLGRMRPRECEDKVRTTSQYKFALCFENVTYPGYVTEKIFDCIAAGSIPVYLGAPDIGGFVPPDVFVNAADFDSWDSLDAHLECLGEKDCLAKIRAGRNFLRSPAGDRHSFEGFAESLMGMIAG